MAHRQQQQMFFLLASIFLTISLAQRPSSDPICRQTYTMDACFDIVHFNTIASYYLKHANNVTSHLVIFGSPSFEFTKKDFQNPLFDKIETLTLCSESLQIIKPEPLTGLRNLNKLEFCGNPISTISENSFTGLNLSAIELGFNEIRNIEEKAFRSQVYLVRISIAGNRLTKLPAALFQGLKSLEFLDLQRNALTSIDENLLQGLITLKKNDFSRNRILSISPNTFKSLTKLTNLNLKHNQLTAIDNDVFLGNTKLKTLDLAHNKLSSLEKVELNIPSLLAVDLGYNNIKNIPLDFFQRLPNLDQITLNGNEFNISTDVFDSLPVLRKVFIGGRNWKPVPLEGFRNTEWKEGDYPRYNIFVGSQYICNINEIPRLNSTFASSVSDIEKVIICLKDPKRSFEFIDNYTPIL